MQPFQACSSQLSAENIQKITLIIKTSKNKLSNSSVGREINYEKDLKLIYRGPMRHSNGPLRL